MNHDMSLENRITRIEDQLGITDVDNRRALRKQLTAMYLCYGFSKNESKTLSNRSLNDGDAPEDVERRLISRGGTRVKFTSPVTSQPVEHMPMLRAFEQRMRDAFAEHMFELHPLDGSGQIRYVWARVQNEWELWQDACAYQRTTDVSICVSHRKTPGDQAEKCAYSIKDQVV